MGNTTPNRALGTTISKGATPIGGLTEINGVDMSADTMDITTLDSSGGYREFLAGFKDAGEISISGYFEPGNAGQTAMVTAFGTGASDTFIITFPTAMGATWTFTGIVTGITTGAALEDPVSFEATIKVSSAPNLGTTASTGANPIALTGTTSALTPTFDIAKFNYYHSWDTTSTITITVTAASHTILLYIDDVFIEALTTATPSTAISSWVIGTPKNIKVIVYEAAKTPKTYTIVSQKTA